jgi:hypothetical protein
MNSPFARFDAIENEPRDSVYAVGIHTMFLRILYSLSILVPCAYYVDAGEALHEAHAIAF